MLEINKLAQEQLVQKPILEQISKEVKDCINNDAKSHDLALILEKKIGEVDLKPQAPKLFRVYQAWIYLLKSEALNLYTDDEVLDLIEKYCLEGLKFGPNFFRNLRVKTVLIPLNFRDDFLVELKDVLKRNTQKIGTANITLARETRPQPPLVKNWLADYDDVMGVEYHEDIERSNYFVRSRSVKGLTDQDKEILRRLFYFYDLLKLKTEDLGGLGSLSAATLDIEVTEAEEKPLKRFEPLFDPLELLEEKVALAPKPAVVPPAPPKPPAEIEKEIEAKRKAEEERIARLEREMRPKVAPPPVEIPKPKPPIPSPKPEVPKPEVAPPPKIKPAPSFPPRPTKPARPPRIEAALPTEPVGPPPKPKVPVKIESIDDIKKLTASDFRGYAEVPRDSARAITEKINSLLAEASPLDRIKALASWKGSDLYKLYIEMGRESMAQEKTVKELADERKVQGKAYLTHEEFEAIVEISGAIG